MTDDLTKSGKHGPEFAMFFRFAKFNVLLSAIIACVGLLLTFANMYAVKNSTVPIRKIDGFLGYFATSGGGGATLPLEISLWIMMIFLMIGLPVISYIAEMQAHSHQTALNNSSLTISSYSILVRGIPPNVNEEQIKEYFTERGYSVSEVSMVYSKILTRVSGEISISQKSDGKNTIYFTSGIEANFIGVAIVTFNCIEDAQDLIKRYELTGWNYLLWITGISGLQFRSVLSNKK